jgi:hypothetical protein
MNVKETAELLEIWKKNNHAEWSDLAFEVVRVILEDRLGELPPQDEAVFTVEPVAEQEKESEEDAELELEEWETRLVDNENQPVYYDTLEVIELRRNIDRLARIVVILSILSGIFGFPTMQSLLRGYFPTNDQLVVSLIASILVIAIGVVLRNYLKTL